MQRGKSLSRWRPQPTYLVGACRGFEGFEDLPQLLFFVDLVDLGHQLEPLRAEPDSQHRFDAFAHPRTTPNALGCCDERHTSLLLNLDHILPEQVFQRSW